MQKGQKDETSQTAGISGPTLTAANLRRRRYRGHLGTASGSRQLYLYFLGALPHFLDFAFIFEAHGELMPGLVLPPDPPPD